MLVTYIDAEILPGQMMPSSWIFKTLANLYEGQTIPGHFQDFWSKNEPKRYPSNYRYNTSEWRRFESRWFCRSGFEFAKTQLAILNH